MLKDSAWCICSLEYSLQWVSVKPTLQVLYFTKWTDVLPQDLVKSRNKRNSSYDFSNRSEIWQASRQERCRDACQTSDRYVHYQSNLNLNPNLNLAVRRLTAYWIETLNDMGKTVLYTTTTKDTKVRTLYVILEMYSTILC